MRIVAVSVIVVTAVAVAEVTVTVGSVNSRFRIDLPKLYHKTPYLLMSGQIEDKFFFGVD